MKNKAPRLINAAYLTCIIASLVLSALLVADVLGRYMTKKEASEKAGVAKWDVKLQSTSTSLDFNGSDHKEAAEILSYDFTVTSLSQVAMEYSVVVTFAAPPPSQVKLCLDNGAWVDCNGTSTEFSFGAFPYAVGDEGKLHQLKLQVEYMQNGAPADFDFESIPVTVTVKARQVA